jgi:hypothetical protein
MADINIKAKIDVDTSGAQKGTKEAQDDIKKTGAAIDKTAESAKKGGGAFSSLGTALKGLGILSAVEAAFGIFKETLGKNQKVADLMTTSMNFLTKIFNDLVDFLSNNIGSVVEWFKQIFENPVESLKSFGDAIKDNIIERFNSFLDTIGYLGTALKKLFTGDFKGAIDSVKEAGKEMVDVLTGVDDTTGKIGKVIDKVVDYTTKTWKAAEAQTALANTAKLSAAQLQGLVEHYDRLAEQQRQLRDDESNSIADRIAANNKLGEILQQQQKAMLALANTRIASAQADLASNKGNIDLQVALTEALNERKAILAQITGLESEQKVNAVALAKEELEMNRSLVESNNAIEFERRKAIAETIENERQKLNALKAIRDEERNVEMARLQENIDATKAGTQARVDAQIAYNEKKLELDLADIEFKKQMSDLDKQDLLNQQAINDAKLASQMQLAQASQQVFSQLSSMFEQGTAASKAAALADIVIGTGVGFVQGLDIAQKGAKATGPAAPFAFPIFYATQIAAVLSAVGKAKNILSQVKGGGGGGASVGASAPTGASTPAPVLPQSASMALSAATIQGIGNAAAGGANRAYVLDSDVRNSDERNARLQRAARLGG